MVPTREEGVVNESSRRYGNADEVVC